MRILKNLFLFVPLFFFIACQGPYDKPRKKPVKIIAHNYAHQQAAMKANAAEESGDKGGEAEKPIEEVVTKDNKGIGPVSSVDIPESINQDMVAAGKKTFNTLCIACHKLDTRFVGPALGDVMKYRSPEWVMNMILNPTEMIQKDPVAKKLLAKYKAPMTDLGLSKEQARQLVEYFRTTVK